MASGAYSTVAGGSGNTASADYSFAAGLNSLAQGQYTVAIGAWKCALDLRLELLYSLTELFAGRGANPRPSAPGSMVLADGQDTTTYGTSTNAFYARFAGGFNMYTGSSTSTGASLAAGSGSWSTLSDVNTKRAFVPVNGSQILDQLQDLTISSWQYKAQPSNIRHVGPTAQDFYRAFGGYGEDERRIVRDLLFHDRYHQVLIAVLCCLLQSSVDADGISLAGLKALTERVIKQEKIIRLQAKKLLDSEAREAALEARLRKVETALNL